MTKGKHTVNGGGAGKPADKGDAGDDQKLISEDAAAAAYRRHADTDILPEAEDGEKTPPPGAEKGEADEAADQTAGLKDLLLRKTADFDNYRKRIERERADFVRRATTAIAGDLLPVLDNLELALSAGQGSDAESFRRGVEMIHKQILDLLLRHGLEPIPAVGLQFDPHVHEAVMHVTSAGHSDGEVIEEMQRGYTLGGRVLRPARVKVATAGDEDEEGLEETPED